MIASAIAHRIIEMPSWNALIARVTSIVACGAGWWLPSDFASAMRMGGAWAAARTWRSASYGSSGKWRLWRLYRTEEEAFGRDF